ncbi:lactococcin 972 family bacteriocin [Actinomadura formosensis]|uniref:lactococcin 972 family bacteriocin n=1 Tax=Actinomadura formosensis TaxID=60706 RepID=UPI0008335D63|nr:lactococcin 972 family bacteriocin [Actinomadura formosensis]
MRKTLKGGLVMAATAGVIILGGAGAAMAEGNAAPAPDPTATEGSVTLDPGTGDVTAQGTKNVGGGTWNYGSNRVQDYGWSDYYHPTNCHGSSARSGRHYAADHGVAAKRWSEATVTKDGTVKVYWTNKC